jgi:hypothetical protein
LSIPIGSLDYSLCRERVEPVRRDAPVDDCEHPGQQIVERDQHEAEIDRADGPASHQVLCESGEHRQADVPDHEDHGHRH